MSIPANPPGFARVGSVYYPVLVAVFTALVIISNVTATKGVAFGPIITDGGFIVFPLTYVIGDVLAEVYGFRAARRAICSASLMNGLAALAFWVTVYLPAADFYPNQEHFANVVGAYTQLIIAGLAGFIVGQTINAWAVVKIKERTRRSTCGPDWWAPPSPANSATRWSSAVSPPGRSASPASATSPRTPHWAGSTRPAVEVVMLPITYRVIAYVKRHEPTYTALV